MIHLITYSDSNYNIGKYRLCDEATKSGWFDTVTP